MIYWESWGELIFWESLAELCSVKIEIIGRSGQLDDAYHFIRKIPIWNNAYVWGTLLGACRIQVKIKLQEVAARHLYKLELNKIGNYLAMLDIHVAAGKKEHAARLRKLMNDKGLIQGLECSWIEVKGRVHMFATGDRLHPPREEIYALLKLTIQLKEAGYEPRPDFMLPHIEQQQEEFVCYHSEKLAIAYGLISFHPSTSFHFIETIAFVLTAITQLSLSQRLLIEKLLFEILNAFKFQRGIVFLWGLLVNPLKKFSHPSL